VPTTDLQTSARVFARVPWSIAQASHGICNHDAQSASFNQELATVKHTTTLKIVLLSLILSITMSLVLWCVGRGMVGQYEWDETPRFFVHHLVSLCVLAITVPAAALAFSLVSQASRRLQSGILMLVYMCIVLGFTNARFCALARSPEYIENGEFDTGYNRDRYLVPQKYWSIDENDHAHRSLKFMPGQAEAVAADSFVGSCTALWSSFRSDSSDKSDALRVLESAESIFVFGLFILLARLLIPSSFEKQNPRLPEGVEDVGPPVVSHGR